MAALKLLRSWVFRFGPIYHRRTLAQGFDEFAAMWLDDFGEQELPANVVHVLAVLTSSGRHVSGRVVPEKLAAVWGAQVQELLKQKGYKMEPGEWQFLPDEMLETIQRLGKLSPEDAHLLVRRNFPKLFFVWHKAVKRGTGGATSFGEAPGS